MGAARPSLAALASLPGPPEATPCFARRIAHFVLPVPQGAQITPDTMLDPMANGAISRSKTTVRRRERITLGIHRGIEIEGSVTTPAAGDMVMRIYWVPPASAYLVIVVGPKTSPVHQDRATFFDSFHIADE